MSKENLCNVGKCKINRRGEKHPMHIIDKKMNNPLKKFDEKFEKWFQNLSTKQLLLLVLGLSVIAVGITTNLVDKIFNEYNFSRPDNLHTIIIEIGIGVTIAVIIWAYSNMQQNKMGKLVKDIKQIIKKEEKIKDEIKEDVANTINLRCDLVIMNLEKATKSMKSYHIEVDPNKKATLLKIAQAGFMRCSRRYNVGIERLEMMKIFGRAITIMYYDLANVLIDDLSWYDFTDPNEIKAFHEDIDIGLKKAKNLKKIITPLASSQVKL